MKICRKLTRREPGAQIRGGGVVGVLQSPKFQILLESRSQNICGPIVSIIVLYRESGVILSRKILKS